MSNKLDARQVISRDTLSQIAPTASKELDDILRSINSELQMPLRMVASSPIDQVLTINNTNVTNSETNRKRTIPHISSTITSFISGSITFPTVSGNNITFSTVGSVPVPMVCTTGKTVKVLIYLDAVGNLGASVGTEATSEALAVVPPPLSGTFSLGYIVMFNSSGTISAVANTNIYQFVGGGGGSGSGDGASLLDPNYDESFVYFTRSDFSIDKKKFFGSTTGTDQVLGFGKIVLTASQVFTSSNLLGPVFLSDNPVINTAQVRLLYKTSAVDSAPVVTISIDGGSSWLTSYQSKVSGLFVIVDFVLPVGSTSTDLRVKVTASASSELAGFGVNLVQDSTGAYAGDATYEMRTITSTEASTGTITLTSVRFTPGANQLHCNYNGHDFMAPDFLELGGGVVQFPLGFFTAGDVAKFYVGYGLVKEGDAALTINNVISANTTMGSLQIPSGFTLDKPYMEIPAGATVSGAGDVSTDKVITGAGVLATTGTVLSRGVAPTQPKFDRIEEATVGAGVVVDGLSIKDSGISFGNEYLSHYDEGTWTPMLSCEIGSLVTASSSNAKYIRIGKMVHASLTITITDKGTGAGGLRVSLPFAAAGAVAGSGVNENNGAGLSVYIGPSTGFDIRSYDATSIITNSRVVTVQGSYWVA